MILCGTMAPTKKPGPEPNAESSIADEDCWKLGPGQHIKILDQTGLENKSQGNWESLYLGVAPGRERRQQWKLCAGRLVGSRQAH